MNQGEFNQIILALRSIYKQQSEIHSFLSRAYGDDFCELPSRRNWIYVGDEEKSGWYKLGKDSSKIPLPPGIKVLVRRIEHAQVMIKGKPQDKLHCYVDGAETKTPYIIRSGIRTWFSRQLLMALSQLAANDSLNNPLKIYAKPSEETVFCSVYLKDSEIRTDPETIKSLGDNYWHPYIQLVNAKL